MPLAALMSIVVLTLFLPGRSESSFVAAADSMSVSASVAPTAPDSSVTTAADAAARPEAAPSQVLGDSLFKALSQAFRYQVAAAVYYRGHRYEVADPRILREGFAYRRIASPGKVPPGAVPLTIPWADVDSLLLRRTYATGLGAGTGLMTGILGGLYGYGIGEMSGAPALVLGVVVGAGAAGLGFLAGGFVGGWFHYWMQVYPEVTPESRKRSKWPDER